MGSSYLPPPEQNVVNVGDEISANALQALQNASPSPTSTNPVATNQSVATAIAAIPLPPPPDLTGYAQLSGATFTGKVGLATISASSPSVNLGGQCDSAPASAANGDLWISNAASPKLTYRTGGINYNLAVLNQFNTFTGQVVINTTSSTTAALRVTQLGTGNAIEVEDSTTPDSTRFVVDQFGKVGIGGVVPAAAQDKVAVHDGNIVFGWPYGVRFGDGTSISSANSLTSQIQAAVVSNIFSGATIYSNTASFYGSATWYDSTYGYDITYTYLSYTAQIEVSWNASSGSFAQTQGAASYPASGTEIGSFSDGSGYTHHVYADGTGGVGSIS